jgi:electron transfer flavoprotein alpha subunit
MSLLIYIEHTNGIIKKNALEAVSYGVAYAEKMGIAAKGVTIGNLKEDEIKKVGSVGLKKVLNIDGHDYLNHQKVSAILSSLVSDDNIQTVVFCGSTEGKGAGSRLAVKINAGIITEVVNLPSSVNPIILKKKAFSGKGFANVEMIANKNIIIISTNSYGVNHNNVECLVENISVSNDDLTLKHKGFNRDTEGISLPDAELVVSAGRGLKGSENWGIIEDLANSLGAATACSKPVSDIGWRPHHEHVGQTGIAISPNLYIAIGISGAIQHLAGVSSSKIIVVINIDSEAPFFKAADYGIVGDAFDVIPKLTAAIQSVKG